MTQDGQEPEGQGDRPPLILRRPFVIAWLVLYVAWLWLAPLLREFPEECAWLQIPLGVSTIFGAMIGIAACTWPSIGRIVTFGVATVVHLLIGLFFQVI